MAKYLVPGSLDEDKKDSRPRSKTVFVVVMVCISVAMLLIVSQANQRQRYGASTPESSVLTAASDSIIQSQLGVSEPPTLADPSAPPENEAKPSQPEVTETIPQEEKIVAQQGPRITYRRREAPTNDEMRRRAQDMKLAALLSTTRANAFEGQQQQPASSVSVVGESTGIQSSTTRGGNTLPTDLTMAALSQGNVQPDPNNQARKEEFFYSGGEKFPGGYLPDIRKPQLTAYELKIGTIIPAILLTGINSDLPGQILAQVSENVYDTATGRYLLIPQGSRLVGIYDSQISYGQKRVMAVWTHLIWPDGSSLNISGMPGIDPSGYSGFRGRVDNHYMELFMAAIVISGFNLAYETIAGDRDSGGYYNNSSSNQVKDAVGEAVAMLGAKIAEREVARQPTIRIKPGYRFSVMINKDIIFPSAWRVP